MRRSTLPGLATALVLSAPVLATPAIAANLEIEALKNEIADQRRELDAQRKRLQSLEDRLLNTLRGTASVDQIGQPSPLANAPPANDSRPAAPVATVGVAPPERERTPEVAVLSDQGGIVTRAGQFTIEPSFEYARADRNRVIFRGIEVPQSVLVGVFDINESRQDILVGAIGLRFGVNSRFEVNGRIPYVYRTDVSVLAAAVQNQNGSADRPDVPARGRNVGDVEFGARYQLTNGGRGFPYLIAGVQAVAPTGTNPFTVPRDTGTGVALRSATGAGFWGVTPTVTALLPSDPAVLFGTLGYTRNFGRGFDGVQINQDVLIDYVKPGDAILGSVGIGISLNPRVALSLGYAHNWSFGTRTQGRAIQRDPINGPTTTPFDSELRDLQIGRLLFGVSYRTSPSTTINWNVEVGATQDAADVRTTLRIPFSFGGQP
ncbi:putative coiled-coil protein SlyX [Polymorphobacter multimanifer]|uniref:Putative coiled-coil protein SlyX n=2 Tax=Polymorphobacter multimanifer TaxID=1070431 RepID=A0A841LAJ7_9SPHN|nr:hypothetical protein [Polymorphobacter multimanifer]MBB6229460.1 putative coiled-coil protein SlyX [Polymorphobacter multimanifer]